MLHESPLYCGNFHFTYFIHPRCLIHDTGYGPCRLLNMRVMITWRLDDEVIKWKHFLRYWPFVRGINRRPVNSPHKGQWRGTLIFYLICEWTNGWVNNCQQMETFFASLASCAWNSPVTGEFPSQRQWRWTLIFYLIQAWANDWVNIWYSGDLRYHSAHYDVTTISA